MLWWLWLDIASWVAICSAKVREGLRMITSSSSLPAQPLRQRLAEVALLFRKLGLTAFGGPAALL